MKIDLNGHWRVKKIGQTVGVLDGDSSVIALLPDRNNGLDSRVKEAYLMAAAPQLFELCWNLKSILENNLIVTKEGFQIDCSEIKKALLDTTLRAIGCRKAPEEP